MKIIKAKACHRIWSLSGTTPHAFTLHDVIAWEIAPDRSPVPITASGRHEKPFVFTNGAAWESSTGETFRNSSEVQLYLRSREVQV